MELDTWSVSQPSNQSISQLYGRSVSQPVLRLVSESVKSAKQSDN
jgi:hypothetical protein